MSASSRRGPNSDGSAHSRGSHAGEEGYESANSGRTLGSREASPPRRQDFIWLSTDHCRVAMKTRVGTTMVDVICPRLANACGYHTRQVWPPFVCEVCTVRSVLQRELSSSRDASLVALERKIDDNGLCNRCPVVYSSMMSRRKL